MDIEGKRIVLTARLNRLKSKNEGERNQNLIRKVERQLRNLK